MSKRIIIAGIGTKVGKTITAAIVATILKGDYWKPIQCGDEKTSDTNVMKKLLDVKQHDIYHPCYNFKSPVSPHHAAEIENLSININSIILPESIRPLIIEGIGGILVPITLNFLTLDLFKKWNDQWIIVSKNYLGSINHTLMTIEILKSHQLSIAGIVFNGNNYLEGETAILKFSKLPFLGRINPETYISKKIIQKYAKIWQPAFTHLCQ